MEGDQALFDKAVAIIQENAKVIDKLPNDQKLEVYALYKQATVGDINTKKPGILDQKGRAKWTAWEKKKGVAQEDAKNQYVGLAKKVLPEEAAAKIA